MPPKTLIFDFDGTIADTLYQVVAICNQLAEEYHFQKVDPRHLKDLRHKTSQEIRRSLKVPVLLIPVLLAQVRFRLRRSMSSVKIIDGLGEVLVCLKRQGHTMGILTSNAQGNVHKFLQSHHLEGFDLIRTSPLIWGKSGGLHAILRERRLSPDQLVYVGDETRDIQAARKAGVRSVAVSWGYNTAEILQACRPDHLVHRPEDLLGVCSKMEREGS